MISIVIPVFKEAENIERTSAAIDDSLKTAGIDYEIIFVDDNSCDGTVDICQKLSGILPIKLIVRKKDKGLAKAVIEGLNHVKGEIIVVMDADLSHPPEAIIKMTQLLEHSTADFVIGSRYIKGGSVDEQWSFFRRLNSWIATIPAKFLVRVKDPMSGFFAFRKDDLPDLSTLSPLGYKIGLEIMVKGAFKNIKEVPIHFSDRQLGQSKLNLNEQLLYGAHILRLFRFTHPGIMRLILYSTVGFSGFLVDTFIYFGLQHLFGLSHVLSRAVSLWPAVTWNWGMHRWITFHDRKKSSKPFQWMKFTLSSLTSFSLNWGVYTLLTRYIPFFQTHLFVAFVTGIMTAAGFNFIFSNYLVFLRQDIKGNVHE